MTATVTLPAGQQVLTLDQDSGGWNINYMTFTSGSGGGTGIGNGTTYTPQWCPQWCQEFNRSAGSPDTTVWNFDLGNNNGWGNAEVEVYCGPPGYPNNPSQCPTTFSTSTAPVYIDGSGHLVIQPRNVNGTWISGRMNTEGKQNFQYGILEASIQLPNTTNQGLSPAFWTLGSNISSVDGPPAAKPTSWRTGLHRYTTEQVPRGTTPQSTRRRREGAELARGTPSQADRQPTRPSIPTGSCGRKMRCSSSWNASSPFFTATPSSLPSGDTWPFNQFTLLKVAVGGTLGGSTSGLTNPGPMIVEYPRVS